MLVKGLLLVSESVIIPLANANPLVVYPWYEHGKLKPSHDWYDKDILYQKKSGTHSDSNASVSNKAVTH